LALGHFDKLLIPLVGQIDYEVDYFGEFDVGIGFQMLQVFATIVSYSRVVLVLFVK